jgi:hypothetical protein
MENGHQHQIVFVDDHYMTKNKALTAHLSTSDRLLWIDYSVAFDDETIKKIIKPFEQGCQGLVFPALKTDSINWELFKQKVLEGTSTEPVQQYAFEFDTVLHKKIKDHIYSIKETDPKCFCVDAKHVYKAFRNKKGEVQKVPYSFFEFFNVLRDQSLKIYAFTDCQITLTYPHECFGNILNCAGIKVAA